MLYRKAIEGTTDTDVAYALAYLAGFQGHFVGRLNNIWQHEGCGRKSVVVFDGETMSRVGGNAMEALAYLGPDIIVSQVYKPSEEGGEFHPADEYVIYADKKKVPAHLIEEVPEEIKAAYAEACQT
jgi:hypothetical protein